VLAIKNLNLDYASNIHRSSVEIERPYARSRVQPLDVVVSVKGTTGRIGIVPDHFDGNISRDLARIRPREDFSPAFVFHMLQSGPAQNRLDGATVGTTRRELSIAILKRFSIPLPATKSEQEAIAWALSEADALIESLEQLLTKKRHLKQGAMQELLTGKKRLQGFVEDWHEIDLGQMGKCFRGVSYNPGADLYPFDTDSTLRLLRSNNIRDARLVLSDMQYVDSRRVSTEQRLRSGDVLICMANGSRDLVGKAGLFIGDDEVGYTFGAFMGCFRPNCQISDPDFVFYLFQTESYRAHIAVLLAGSSINNLTPKNVEAFAIPIPPQKLEQAAIAAVISDLDAEIATLEAKLEKARQVKQGMMQKLLTGRIRLV
jgi:type I restriction enzyme S subunit